MSEMVERAAKAIFLSRYSQPEHAEYWPDRLDELVSGPPFDADGYRQMARAAIEAVKQELAKRAGFCKFAQDRDAIFGAVEELEDALQP